MAEEAKARYSHGGDVDYYYNVSVRDWKNYGKDRTYFNVYENRTHSTHCKVMDFGFFDNKNGEYHAGKHDITKQTMF